jgi:hypothetical protein
MDGWIPWVRWSKVVAVRLVLAICLCLAGGATCFVAVSHVMDFLEDTVVVDATEPGRIMDFAEPALADTVVAQAARGRPVLAVAVEGLGAARRAATSKSIPGEAIVPPIVRRLPKSPEEPKAIAPAIAVAEAPPPVADPPPLPVQNSRRPHRLSPRAIARRPNFETTTRSALGGPLPRQ